MIESLCFFANAKPAGSGGFLIQFAPFILIFVLFWFLIIRPQRKREKSHQEMLNALKSGDKVVLNSGIYGTVHEVTPQTVVVEIASKVRVTVQRNAVSGMNTSVKTDVASPSASTASTKKSSAKKKRRK